MVYTFQGTTFFLSGVYLSPCEQNLLLSFWVRRKKKRLCLIVAVTNCWSSQSCFSHQPGDELACCTKCMAIRFGYKTVFKLLATSLRASSPGGKRKESFQLCPSGIWIPPPIPLWLPVDWTVKFLPISMK